MTDWRVFEMVLGRQGRIETVSSQDERRYHASRDTGRNHAVDLDPGALVPAEIHPADKGDTTTLKGTLKAAAATWRQSSGAFGDRSRGLARAAC